MVPNNRSENFEIGVWSVSDWASEQAPRRSCSGDYIKVNGVTVGHWSKTQLNVALSSGEAELNASVKALSETCEGGVDVVGVVSPLVRGGAQVLHGDQVVELSVLLEVHEKEEVEEDGEGQIEVDEWRMNSKRNAHV